MSCIDAYCPIWTTPFLKVQGCVASKITPLIRYCDFRGPNQFVYSCKQYGDLLVQNNYLYSSDYRCVQIANPPPRPIQPQAPEMPIRPTLPPILTPPKTPPLFTVAPMPLSVWPTATTPPAVPTARVQAQPSGSSPDSSGARTTKVSLVLAIMMVMPALLAI